MSTLNKRKCLIYRLGMHGFLERAFGYQGDTMNLPVPDLVKALPFYENVLGFKAVSAESAPHPAAILTRDSVRIGLIEWSAKRDLRIQDREPQRHQLERFLRRCAGRPLLLVWRGSGILTISEFPIPIYQSPRISKSDVRSGGPTWRSVPDDARRARRDNRRNSPRPV